ncbi:surface presentation of antigens (SPOA) protein [Acidimicrobium ferrooxidans DSM 10331]|uniref:Flagellar motor switch protein FliM n=1 Tax=Acidimicrobium ferrooxidans (strain DSM 10331 / JCM 15462 / NBRC 103882 / ICP) TaxID=525909 RepID=C7M221_ACIFD|nr:FliM/FliN family flagellar motor switch protein [Acidimicrobium ferrooxidans]ACU53119.1 surface presentation of antigens (SPOA) protein [Acidimicrobium ferrooxidans DSM 10331]
MSGENEARERQVRTVDFRLPHSFDRAEQRGLELLVENALRPAATLMGASLRRGVRLELGRMDQLPWEQVVAQQDGPALVISFALVPLGSRGVLRFGADAALRLLDLRLGGDGSPIEPRALTELEQGLLVQVFSDLLVQLASSLQTLLDVRLDRVGAETSLEFVQVISPGEMCLVVPIALGIGDELESELTLYLPYSMLRPVVELIAQRAIVAVDRGGDTFRDLLAARLHDVRLEVSVRFEPTSISSRTLLELAPGDVVPLGHRQGQPAWVIVDRTRLHRAVMGQSGSRVAAVIIEEEEEAHA